MDIDLEQFMIGNHTKIITITPYEDAMNRKAYQQLNRTYTANGLTANMFGVRVYFEYDWEYDYISKYKKEFGWSRSLSPLSLS
jgi:hypothetical protein